MESTCWTVIEEAAAGCAQARKEFALRYSPVILTYLRKRWNGSAHYQEVEDAVQQVFVECFRRGGVLEKTDPDRPGGFRAFLYGVIRNIALRTECRLVRDRKREPAAAFDLDEVERRESSLSRVFDQAWARAVLREAAARHAERAEKLGESARMRVELLRLKFQEDLPIREIAKRFKTESTVLHREYAQARKEFRAAFLEVVSFHHPGSRKEVEKECARLLDLLR